VAVVESKTDWVVIVAGQKLVTYNNLRAAEERKGLPGEVTVVLAEMCSNSTELEVVTGQDIGADEVAVVEEIGEFDY
jgi:hypothetical protein